MQRVSRSICGLAMFAAGSFGSALSQDLLECVDPDVRAGLLGSPWGPERSVTRDWPAALEGLALPAAFDLVGTSAAGPTSVTSLKTGLEPAVAIAALQAALEAGGWAPMRMPGARGLRAGGFAGSRSPESTTYCRDAEILDVLSGQRSGATFVSLQTRRAFGPSVCNTDSDFEVLVWSGLQAYMPTLRLPEDTSAIGAGGTEVAPAAALAFAAGGMAGDGRTLTTSATIATGLDLAALERHFAEQLAVQDWQRDAQWTGVSSAGSTWTASRVDAETGNAVSIVGTLTIARGEAARYETTFHVTKVD